MKRVISVVAAVIENENGEWLIAKRPKHKTRGGYWEFPGGKIEAGEEAQTALKREISEELGIRISIIAKLTNQLHHYPDISIELSSYLCKAGSEAPHPHEHTAIEWVSLSNIHKYQLSAADNGIIEVLKERAKQY
ncbi:(deoxy)nucleoside triphosphate pyrophosphohydrolase [Corallincola holothuriorum]|uniref:8-oxo-dGTP diphosphatase n=1 Tax=Corallincola holothuriorum TaxID=2282215 RepID=A0A368MYE0_9GAMM|nr:(deoxy)nucleoside triphosphate pyrophosphohydrolase [Corallincola holothuriorum]RCU43218.1 (deoxy)nucleoside triphosphate pyrophosphohydrolase [Corallincola holothuriorum]